jgi:hypothetical protein
MIVNVYRPPSTSVADFLTELHDFLASLISSVTDRLLLCGDLNCPGVDDSTVNSDLAVALQELGLTQHVCRPTRKNHLLDIIATDDSLSVSEKDVDDAGCISDHRLVVVSINYQSTVKKPAVKNCRRIRDINLLEFEAKLRASSLFTSPSSTAEAFAEQLEEVVVSALDELAPLRKFKRRLSRNITRWLSPAAIGAKRTCRRLERRWRSHQQASDRAAYRRACCSARKLIQVSRRDYFQQKLSSASDAKQRWSVAKLLLHSADTAPYLDDIESRRLCCDFSNFFVDKVMSLKQAVAKTVASLAPSPFTDPAHAGPQFLAIPPTTTSEVANLLASLPPKSSSVDYIPTSLLKSCTVFAELISKLANQSFAEGQFPGRFKLASVTPLLKKPGLDRGCVANYRPISNLNNISKTIEHLFLARFQPHILLSPNFNSMQSAYRPYHSTETALNRTLNDVYQSIDHGEPTLLVSLDLSAAFDTIDHSSLLSRLNTSFGVSDTALSWLASYLSGRSQAVRIGSESSPTTNCELGVPQGSVLGPILFSIFVSPVGHLVSSHQVKHQQYADDTQLYFSLSPKQPHLGIDTLQRCLHSLHAWFSLNGLSLNPSKSDAVLFSTRQRRQSFAPLSHVNVSGTEVKLSDSLTTLGVILDNNLTFNNHISHLCKSSLYHLRSLRYIRPCLTLDMAKSVAVAIVQSRLDYCNSLFFGTSQHNIRKLQRIQNTLARIVVGYPLAASSSELLYNLHWLPVHHRVNFKIALLTYKILTFNQPSYLASLVNFNIAPRTLRSSDQHLLYLPRTCTVTGGRAFNLASPKVWNSLPISIRSSPSIASFKQHLKTFYFSSAFP